MKGLIVSLIFVFSMGLVAAQGPNIILEWDANSEVDLAGYNIYRCSVPLQDPDCTNYISHVQNIGVSPNPTTTDSDVQYGFKYCYVATAFNTSDQESGYSNSACGVVLNPGSPTAPTGLTVSVVQGSTAYLELDRVWNASVYHVWEQLLDPQTGEVQMDWKMVEEVPVPWFTTKITGRYDKNIAVTAVVENVESEFSNIVRISKR